MKRAKCWRANAAPGAVKITGGGARGRAVRVPPRGVRPSGSRLRESLFNCLGQTLGGLSCLDLFAGSGVLGLEAASRGAAKVVFVERQQKTAATIRAAAEALGVAAEVQTMAAEKFLARAGEQGEQFDLIFLDPPYADYPAADSWTRLLSAIAPRLKDGGRVYREAPAPYAPPPPWVVLQDKRAGRVFWQILQRAQ